jgi:hypothetical protein
MHSSLSLFKYMIAVCVLLLDKHLILNWSLLCSFMSAKQTSFWQTLRLVIGLWGYICISCWLHEPLRIWNISESSVINIIFYVSLFWAAAIVPITYFCRRNILLLSNELLQNIIPYVMTKWKCEKYTYARFEVFMAMKIQVVVLWVVMW